MATTKTPEPVDVDEPVAPGDYDSKQKYVTVTRIQHGNGSDVVDVPTDVEFSQYASNFTDDELNAFVAQGTIAPMSDVNADISDQNDALKTELENTQQENEDLAAKVAELQKQLDEAKKPATP